MRDDSQRRFLAQYSLAMLEQCCSHSKQCCNNVAMGCYAKNLGCQSSSNPDPVSLEHQNDLLSNIKAPCNPRHLSTHAIKHVWNSTKKSPVWTGLKNYRILLFVIFREEGARRFCWDKGEVLDHLRVIWIPEQDIRQSRASLFLLTVDRLLWDVWSSQKCCWMKQVRSTLRKRNSPGTALNLKGTSLCLSMHGLKKWHRSLGI